MWTFDTQDKLINEISLRIIRIKGSDEKMFFEL